MSPHTGLSCWVSFLKRRDKSPKYEHRNEGAHSQGFMSQRFIFIQVVSFFPSLTPAEVTIGHFNQNSKPDRIQEKQKLLGLVGDAPFTPDSKIKRAAYLGDWKEGNP